MLIKVTSLKEMREKGWTLEKQIEYEAKELSNQYEAEAIKDLSRAQRLAKTPAVQEMLDWHMLKGLVVGKARKRAFDETAQKYRREASDNLGTLSEQQTREDRRHSEA
jgi:hypothetical protein